MILFGLLRTFDNPRASMLLGDEGVMMVYKYGNHVLWTQPTPTDMINVV